MKTNKLMLRIVGLMLLFTVVAASAADAPRLTFKFKTVNVRRALQTEPAGINNKGVIVGSYQDKKGNWHGYILKGKSLTTLDDPKGTNTPQAWEINSSGSVVGYYTNSSGTSVGFLYTPEGNQYTDVPGPNGVTPSQAVGINDQGWIVGYYYDGITHGFVLQGTKYTTLDVPKAGSSFCNGINNKGNIVLGWTNSKGDYEGALTKKPWQNYKTINVPGAGPDGSIPSDINNEGDIAFVWYDSSGLQHGALRRDGKYYKFDHPKAYQTNASGINDRKTIVGYYLKKSSPDWSGFEATYK
jgi:uncharacterized membrane protein